MRYQEVAGQKIKKYVLHTTGRLRSGNPELLPPWYREVSHTGFFQSDGDQNESLFPFLANPVVYTYQLIRVPVNS